MEGKFEAFDPSRTLSIEESCLKLGDLLGLGKPVPEHVMLGALNDPTYAHNLIACRNSPVFLEQLLQHPPITVARNHPVTAPQQNNLDLLKKATAALWKWGKIGFTVVDDETYQRRLDGCSACEHLTDPPQRFLYKLARRKSAVKKVCGLCGCFVVNKAKLPSETCPARHNTLAGLNRWGEPFD